MQEAAIVSQCGGFLMRSVMEEWREMSENKSLQRKDCEDSKSHLQ